MDSQPAGNRPAQPQRQLPRPLVTLHLPLAMGLVGQVLALVAEEYPGATVGNGSATVTSPEGVTIETASVMVVMGQEPA